MTYVLEATENLRSPDYWDGIDYQNLDPLDQGEPAPEGITAEKFRYAAAALLNAVRDIAAGEYHEHEVPASNDGSQIKQYPEGTVLLMDREYLLW